MNHLYHDVRTATELIQHGTSSSRISSLLKQGKLHKISHNAYVDTGSWRTWDARTKCQALHIAVLKNNPTYVLSHESAALWWKAPLLRLPQQVNVSAPSTAARSRNRITVHSNRLEICKDAHLQHSALVTSPLQTVLDCAQSLPFTDSLCIADFMLHTRLCYRESLRPLLEAAQGRGARNARTVAQRMSSAAESPAETLTRALLISWDIELPQEQVEIWVNARSYRPDFLWQAQKVILEVDGEVKYSGVYGDPVDVIQAEHRRQRELEQLGYTVIRVRWRDIHRDPEKLRFWLYRAGVRSL